MRNSLTKARRSFLKNELSFSVLGQYLSVMSQYLYNSSFSCRHRVSSMNWFACCGQAVTVIKKIYQSSSKFCVVGAWFIVVWQVN